MGKKFFGFGKLLSLAQQIFSKKNKISSNEENWKKLIWVYTNRSYTLFEQIFNQYKNKCDETTITLLSRNLFVISLYTHYLYTRNDEDKENEAIQIVKWDDWNQYGYDKRLKNVGWLKRDIETLQKPEGDDPFKDLKALSEKIDKKNETQNSRKLDSFSFKYDLFFRHASMYVHERISCNISRYKAKEGEIEYSPNPKFYFKEKYIYMTIIMFMPVLEIYNNVFKLGFNKKLNHLQDILLKESNKSIKNDI